MVKGSTMQIFFNMNKVMKQTHIKSSILPIFELILSLKKMKITANIALPTPASPALN